MKYDSGNCRNLRNDMKYDSGNCRNLCKDMKCDSGNCRNRFIEIKYNSGNCRNYKTKIIQANIKDKRCAKGTAREKCALFIVRLHPFRLDNPVGAGLRNGVHVVARDVLAYTTAACR
jgi:hypothetical protein